MSEVSGSDSLAVPASAKPSKEDVFNIGERVAEKLVVSDPLTAAIDAIVEDVVEARAAVAAEAIRQINALREQERQIVGTSPGRLEDGSEAPRILTHSQAHLKNQLINKAMTLSTQLSAALNDGRWTCLAKSVGMPELGAVPFFAPRSDDGCDCRK